MFSKSIVLFMLIFVGVTSRRSSQFYFIQVVRFWNCSGYHFQLSILCVVSLYEYHINLFENFRKTVETRNFPIPNTYWSGFGIFKQNRKNPDEIGMFGRSELVIEIQMDKNHTRGEGHASVFLFKFKFSFDHLQLLQFICYFEVEIRKNKITLPLK